MTTFGLSHWYYFCKSSFILYRWRWKLFLYIQWISFNFNMFDSNGRQISVEYLISNAWLYLKTNQISIIEGETQIKQLKRALEERIINHYSPKYKRYSSSEVSRHLIILQYLKDTSAFYGTDIFNQWHIHYVNVYCFEVKVECCRQESITIK